MFATPHPLQLHECSHRRTIVDKSSGALRFECELAQQILGLESAHECDVDETICASCGNYSLPTHASPNPVVASVVWRISDRIAAGEPVNDDKLGKALQAQRYVLPSLAEDYISHSSITAAEPASKPSELSFDSRVALPGDTNVATVIRHEKLTANSGRARATVAPRRARVGIVGYNTASGLGYVTRDLAIHEIADRWLIAAHRQFNSLKLPALNSRCRIDVASIDASPQCLSQWLDGLDWVLFPELSPFRALPWLAREIGVRVALIPMWEWMTPCAEWLRCVDKLLCPTRHAFNMFHDWKRRFGFTWEVDYVPWPVAVDRFPFRVREKCERFVYIDGTGGVVANRLDGTPSGLRRKGLDLVLEAARLAPEVPWIVCTQDKRPRSCPGNVVIKPPLPDNAALYDEGDVCVQPSRWEGLGLQLLECQAAGLPLVTTDTPPMNEYQPLRLLRPQRWEWGQIYDAQPIRIPLLDAALLASMARELHGCDVSAASRAARSFVEQHHNWAHTAAPIRQLFDSTI